MVVLPNRLSSENISICLISKDEDENESDETIQVVKNILENHEIKFVDNIIPFDKLKKEYKGTNYFTYTGYSV